MLTTKVPDGIIRITCLESVPGIPEPLMVYTDVRPDALENKEVIAVIAKGIAEATVFATKVAMMTGRAGAITGVTKRGY